MTIARALMVQLARLGDLLQSVPAIASLTDRSPETMLDLLCPAPLATIGRLLPGIHDVLPWDGADWARRAAQAAPAVREAHLEEAARCLASLAPYRYERAYVLNQHPRALLAAALLAQETIGPRVEGPLDERLTPWAAYVRDVAGRRRSNRVHLADAFCGLCGVSPPGRPIAIAHPVVSLPSYLEPIGREGGPWIGVIVGAGDPARVVPVDVWRQLIVSFLAQTPRGRLVLVGHGQERERARAIQDSLPPAIVGRVWDATGQTSLSQLAEILTRCRAVVGADTGPLHLAAAMGTSVVGWYFARARVHETGPYGTGHVVWQAEDQNRHDPEPPPTSSRIAHHRAPSCWPIRATVSYLLDEKPEPVAGWSVWTSHCDRWGAYFVESGQCPIPPREREALWQELQPAHS